MTHTQGRGGEGAEDRSWIGGLTPREWFETIKGRLCCQDCEQTALVHARLLYREQSSALDALVKATDAYLDSQPEEIANDDRRTRFAFRNALVQAIFAAKESTL